MATAARRRVSSSPPAPHVRMGAPAPLPISATALEPAWPGIRSSVTTVMPARWTAAIRCSAARPRRSSAKTVTPARWTAVITMLGCQITPLVCDDGNACTVDSCDPALGCQTAPLVCDDGDACTDGQLRHGARLPRPRRSSATTGTPARRTAATRRSAARPAPLVCDDGNACTDGHAAIRRLGCADRQPLVCDDGNACTTDSCDARRAAARPDAARLRRRERLHGRTPATRRRLPDATPLVCDDGNACTTDSCDTALALPDRRRSSATTATPARWTACDTTLGCHDRAARLRRRERLHGGQLRPALGCQTGRRSSATTGTPARRTAATRRSAARPRRSSATTGRLHDGQLRSGARLPDRCRSSATTGTPARSDSCDTALGCQTGSGRLRRRERLHDGQLRCGARLPDRSGRLRRR